MTDNVLYEKLIYDNEPKAYQLKLVCNNFKDRDYIHIRKYFLSYEGEYIPSKEGVSIEANIDSISALIDGLMDLCSKSEIERIINKHNEKYKNLFG